MTVASRARRAIEVASGARDRRSPSTERALLVAAAVLFVVITALSLSELPPLRDDARWWLLAPAALLSLVGTALNGGEVWLGARLHGVRVRPRVAFSTSALSSAANLMPVPGAALVKVRALRQHGLGTGLAVRATAGLGIVWVGLGLVLAGALQLASDATVGAIAALVGLAVTVLGLASLGRTTWARRGEAVALETASVLATTVRLTLVLAALGFDGDVADAAALAAAGIVASAAGLFPGGLGLRELLSGLTAGLVGLDPAVGVVVAAVDRVVTLAVLGVISGALIASGSADAVADEVAPDVADAPTEGGGAR